MNPDVTGLLESLPGARWFGGKGRPISDMEVVDLGVARTDVLEAAADKRA